MFCDFCKNLKLLLKPFKKHYFENILITENKLKIEKESSKIEKEYSKIEKEHSKLEGSAAIVTSQVPPKEP